MFVNTCAGIKYGIHAPFGYQRLAGREKTAKHIGGPGARKSMCVYTSMNSYKHA